jgi:hypothetical protein
MKSIISILFLFVSINLYSQTIRDSVVCLPIKQVIEVADKYKECREKNAKYDKLVNELKYYTLIQDTIIENATLALNKKDIEIASYRKALGDYGIQNGKLVWYKNPKINFFLGIITGGSLVYIGTRIF